MKEDDTPEGFIHFRLTLPRRGEGGKSVFLDLITTSLEDRPPKARISPLHDRNTFAKVPKALY